MSIRTAEPNADSTDAQVSEAGARAAEHPGYWGGKVVLITGGSSGLGFELSKSFSEEGARVVIAARDQDKLDRAQRRLREFNLDVTTISADVTDDAQVDSMIDGVIDRFGQLDVLVNNVGRSTRSDVLETPPEEFQSLLETNFLTVVRCTRAAMPHLIRTKGHLVNVGSLSAKTVSPYLSAYAASKFPVAAYTQQLRIEGPREVHYLLVCPGPIARDDAGGRYNDAAADLPERAKQPGAGARLKRLCPKKLSRKILQACQRRKPELVVPSKAKILFVVSQLWPSLGDWLLRRWT